MEGLHLSNHVLRVRKMVGDTHSSGLDSGRQSYSGSPLKPPYGFTRVRSRGGTKNPMPMDKDPTGNGPGVPLWGKTQHHSVTCR